MGILEGLGVPVLKSRGRFWVRCLFIQYSVRVLVGQGFGVWGIWGVAGGRRWRIHCFSRDLKFSVKD